MELKNIYNQVIFSDENIKNISEYIQKINKTLSNTNLSNINLSNTNLSNTNLFNANLFNANLSKADLSNANLSNANLSNADLSNADLSNADLSNADLSNTNLFNANLFNANLFNADLSNADLSNADLFNANLSNTKGLIKIMGVTQNNYYWKRFCEGLNNNGYQFYVGLNTLRNEEIFASDERIMCSYPGFYFASRSWCAINYPKRPLEAKIRIPKDALINEPWATDGKASADKIEIIQVFDVKTGEDVTEQYKRK